MNNQHLPQRKSPRLKGYDYSSEGLYFITICTHNRKHVFGNIVDDKMILNDWGQIATDRWEEIPEHFPHIELDLYVIMPNHVHGILLFINSTKHTLGTVVSTYKAAVTRQINRTTGSSSRRFWQSSFHDHIITSERSLNEIRQYVLYNPALWAADRHFTVK